MGETKTRGKLLGIAIRSHPGAPMEALERVSIYEETGLAGDGRKQSRRRQVTILSRSSWQDACNEISRELPWTTRRANLLVEDIPLEKSTGSIIKMGKVIMEITGETSPCDVMEAASPGLQAALASSWRGGVTCRVLESGDIRVGDPVVLYSSAN